MPDDTKPKKYFELSPEDISKIIANDHDEYNAFLKAMREGKLDEFFDRDKKAMGGQVGSLMDKPLYTPSAAQVQDTINILRDGVRQRFAEGGDSNFPGPDDPIGQTKYMISILTPPKDSYQAFLLESLEADLKKLQSKDSK